MAGVKAFLLSRKNYSLAFAGRRKIAPRRTRTPNLLVRSQTLYPVELWAHYRDQKPFIESFCGGAAPPLPAGPVVSATGDAAIEGASSWSSIPPITEDKRL